MTVTTHVMPGEPGSSSSLTHSITMLRTRLDAAESQPGYLDVKMRTEIISQPRDLVAVLGTGAQLSCQVSNTNS